MILYYQAYFFRINNNITILYFFVFIICLNASSINTSNISSLFPSNSLEKWSPRNKSISQLERYNTHKELIQGYSTSMAEATSDNFKNVIESIVGDLNSYFEK